MRIAVIITARPSYAKLKTVIAALLARSVDVQIICAASALLERYGRVRDVIAQDFPHVEITDIWSTHEGANLVTSVKETAAVAAELAGVLSRHRPDRAIVVADRHEVLAAGQAVAYQHIPLIHLQGGERSGSIDDKVRDALTHLADLHFVSTERAKWRVYGLTGSDRIWNVGCPSIDLAKQAISEPSVTNTELGGVGWVDVKQPFLVMLQHPVTNEMTAASDQIDATLDALLRLKYPAIIFWPGQDAGAELMAKRLRLFANEEHAGIQLVRNLPPSRFLKLLTQSLCLVGNSSAGIRECSFLGVPVVNIGSRQHGRERGPNVVDCASDQSSICCAVQTQVAHGPYQRTYLYGHGDAGERIAEVLTRE